MITGETGVSTAIRTVEAAPLLSLLALLCAVCAGCGVCAGCPTTIGPNRVVEAPQAAPAPIHERWRGCRAVGAFAGGRSLPESGSVPMGFVPTTVVWCVESQLVQGSTPGSTQDDQGLERRATTVAPVLAFLATPSLQPSPGSTPVCTADGVVPSWLFLLDRKDRWIVPKLPTTECGKPRPPVGGGAPPWMSLRYVDTVVCVFRHNRDGSLSCR